VIAGRNIVCVASNWFEHPTSKHHVMRILAERSHVLWVNYHASRRPALTGSDSRLIVQRLRAACRGRRRVAPAIDVLSPLLLPLPACRLARRFNAGMMTRQLRAALRALPRRPMQLWLFTPDVPELIGRLRAERVIYYCVDDFAAFRGFDGALVSRLERQTLAGADVVIATSRPLYERLARLHANTHFVPHGVDFEHFAAAATAPPEHVPEELRRLPRPVLGYLGLIADYVDLELLAAVARQRPDWSIVLVGAVRCSTAALATLPNVHLLGGRPYEKLPRYCRGFDVGLIPFRMNRLTYSANPIKLREYLAAGLPVVSTSLPEVLPYRPAVHSGATADEFIAACLSALARRTPRDAAARQALVRDESWRVRVAQLARIVQDGARVRGRSRMPRQTANAG